MENLERKNLEERIILYLDRAKKYLNSNYNMGKDFYKQAEKLYKTLKYNFKIETQINQVFLKYFEAKNQK